MQSEPFDFRTASQLAADIARAPILPSSIELAVVHLKIDEGKHFISFERSSGDESIDSAIKVAIEEAISRQKNAEALRLDCHLGFGSVAQQSTKGLIDFHQRVWFRPSYFPTPNSPCYPRYWSDGKPDLVPYEQYVERKLRQSSDVRGPILVEVVIDRTAKASTKLRKSSGSTERDQLAVTAVTAINYKDLPDPGPNRIRMVISFERFPHIVNLNAEYDE